MRRAWAAIVMLAALVVGCLVGVLSWLDGANPLNAVIAAGAFYCGLASFGFTAFEFLTGQPGNRQEPPAAGRGR